MNRTRFFFCSLLFGILAAVTFGYIASQRHTSRDSFLANFAQSLRAGDRPAVQAHMTTEGWEQLQEAYSFKRSTGEDKGTLDDYLIAIGVYFCRIIDNHRTVDVLPGGFEVLRYEGVGEGMTIAIRDCHDGYKVEFLELGQIDPQYIYEMVNKGRHSRNSKAGPAPD